MISNEKILEVLNAHDEIFLARVSGDLYHYVVTVVSDHFFHLKKLQRHQFVYKILNEYIASGEMHALSLHTWTVTEWENQENG